MKKIALITGASAGFGEATAKTLAKEGFDLILSARRQAKLAALAEEIKREYPIDVLIIPLDVTNKAQVKEAFQNLPNQWRNIDVLINNAGLALDLNPIVENKEEDWDAVINTNVLGLLYVTKQVLPQMIERQTGHIINISSVSGKDVYANGTVYCASKHAVQAITQGLRLELLGHNIKVTTICPGAANTEFSTVRFKGDKKRADQTYTGMQPLSAQDIAESICYCLHAPKHVVISELEVVPIQQSGVYIHRQ